MKRYGVIAIIDWTVPRLLISLALNKADEDLYVDIERAYYSGEWNVLF